MANPLQIRSPKDLQETFKAFAQDNGLSQGDALELLLSSFDMELYYLCLACMKISHQNHF